MVIIILGAPGTGKGTMSKMLSGYYNIPHISTGQIIREKIADNTEYSKEVKKYVDKGELVPDNIIKEIIKARLKRKDAENGFILDGFPRTIKQAEDLDQTLENINKKIEIVIDLTASKETIIKRMTNRRICMKCGASYDIERKPPKIKDICDECQTELIQRKDDLLKTITRRLIVYRDETLPLISYYNKRKLLKTINGEGEKEEVFERIINE